MVRHPNNAEGPFYVVNGECISCGAPKFEAPELIAHDAGEHCFFARQPETSEELNSAIRAVWTSCCQSLRYAGDDPAVLSRFAEIGESSQCDRTLVADVKISVRNWVRFSYVEARSDSKLFSASHVLKAIANILTSRRDIENSDFVSTDEEGSFLRSWISETSKYSVTLRLKRSGARWTLVVGGDETHVGDCISMDRALQSSERFTEVQWFTADEARGGFGKGRLHPY